LTRPWKTDRELFSLAQRELFTTVVGAVLDKIGMRRQFLPAVFQPMSENMVLIARVRAESKVREALRSGMSAVEAFSRFGAI
jgi:hypothetical protein